MGDEILREEEVATPDQMLVLLFVGLTFVPADIDFPGGTNSNPSRIDEVVDESVFPAALKNGISVLDGIDLVDPEKVVVVTVLIAEQLELRVKAVRRCQGVLS